MTSFLDIGLHRIAGYLSRRRWFLSPGACAPLRRKGDNERTNERASERVDEQEKERRELEREKIGEKRRQRDDRATRGKDTRGGTARHGTARHGGEIALTHNTIRRLRLLRWILKDPRDYYFFLFFHFHSSIIISEERGADGCARATTPSPPPSSLSHSDSLTPRHFFLRLSSVCLYLYTRSSVGCGLPALFLSRFGCALEFVYVLVASQVELGWVWVGLDAWKPWTTLGRLVGFPPRLSARIEAHRHGSNVGTTAAA